MFGQLSNFTPERQRSPYYSFVFLSPDLVFVALFFPEAGISCTSCRDLVAGVGGCCWRKGTLWEQTGSGGAMGAAEWHLHEVTHSGTPEVFSEIKPT